MPIATATIDGQSASETAPASASASRAGRTAGSAAWKTAPETASSSAPANTRSIASTPEAMPAFAAGIAAIAAVDIGA